MGLILCPEALEHITNHEQFFQNLSSLPQGNTTFVITGPNAFSLDNFGSTFRRFESVNTDHKYWFTFYTLSPTLAATGWQAHRLIHYGRSRDRFRNVLLSDWPPGFPAFLAAALSLRQHVKNKPRLQRMIICRYASNRLHVKRNVV
jgi:hypothetical protein